MEKCKIMLFKQETIRRVLDIKEDVFLMSEEIAANLKVTFFPYDKNNNNSGAVSKFSERLKDSLIKLGVNIIDFKDATVELSILQKIKLVVKIFSMNLKIFLHKCGYKVKDDHIRELSIPFLIKFGPKVKKGIAIIVTGEGESGNLAMDNTISFRKNPVITIIDKTKDSDEKSYLRHMDIGLNLFAFHMTNLAITVGEDDWTLYSFNGSYPTFPIREDFDFNVLHNFIPKVGAPVMPPKLDDFVIKKDSFIIDDEIYAPYIQDLIEGGLLLEKTNLYPKRKSVSDLNFRNSFYKWVGSIYLDGRNGMSYGFIVRQLPVELSQIIPVQEFEYFENKETGEEKIINKEGKVFLRFSIFGQEFFVKVPDVWVLSSKSGADKSHLNKQTDIIKMGLVGGRMIIETPPGINIKGDYKPSFDTRVILAHAVANAILGSIFAYFKPHWEFSKKLNKKGMALAHWHGYINHIFIPKGWEVYGHDNLPVSCSSPQSALYAFYGKIEAGLRCLADNKEYKGDAHIEPHHGVNISYPSLKELGEFITSRPEITELGDRYLVDY